ncbi:MULTISPECIES: amino acid ABC transporter permease [Bosea]|jgi:polar amino acid transport system permease protein|uniref:amino acid ABC transporter permease n=1 Tax=Bosea TaxID=85413 RepID=UPI00214F6B60|nr:MULTISPECIES: amino acid ABC transporter permease [Bosea]MCR4520695.1 amino acid ABC transporter permease [Bosea sp. 47.2.35]MDR6828363.1 polar amino acid transport system permease protein [Bosea robiniae]MDR6895022.1 polar amino acid transport system permease protein [Bosea sp. BE109]MDR7138412.1 polar amino acid transport system permease protein [Bosea sp. BE168]MDR7175111.1 polar amino acid transport system permease protein [Bosea sp. BE271]
MATLIQTLPFLVDGLLMTLLVSACVIVLSLIVGLPLGCVLAFGPLWARAPIRLYADFVRGVPILVLLYFVYYGLPAIKVNLPSLLAAIVALTAFKSAQIIEITRGSFQSIPTGQTEAAKAIGLTLFDRFVHVLAPQAVRRFLPPFVNSVVDTVKGSSLVSLLGIVDLMLSLQQVIGRTHVALPLYLIGALMYFAINFPLSALSRRLEKRFV